MPCFDRFDICEAYLAIEIDYHKGGWLQERPSNRRRMESTDVQLHRIQFRPGAAFNGYKSLSENGREIYDMLRERYGFGSKPDLGSLLRGGPGHDGYAYNAAVYCVDCGQDIARKLYPEMSDGFEDSESFPQPIFFGEADCPQNCDSCGEYLYGQSEDDSE
jgi:hypothetical protein